MIKFISYLLYFINLFRVFGYIDEAILYNLENHGPLKIVLSSSNGGRSHIKGVFEIGELLLKRGHSVTYVSTDDNIQFLKGYNINNYTLGPHYITNEQLESMLQKNILLNGKIQDPAKSNMLNFLDAISKSYDMFQPLEDYFIEVQPDLVVCDFINLPCKDVAKKLKLPLIVTLQTTDFPGITSAPFITQELMYGPITMENLGYFGRFKYIIDPILNMRHLLPYLKMINEIKKKYSLPMSSNYLDDFNYSLNIANTFPGFEPALSLNPNLVQVGPIVSPLKQELDDKFQQFMNTHNNVLLIGFGSNAILESAVISKVLQSALHALENKVIDGVLWSLGRTKIEDFPEYIKTDKHNIKVKDLFQWNDKINLLKWVPQQALLNHKNTKVFISHGGLESLFETIYSGTPVLTLSMFGDQFRNARKIEMMGVGEYINIETFDKYSLTKQMETIILDKNNSFKNNLSKWKTITFHSSKKILLATDLFEQHAYTAKACRQFDPFTNEDRLPCEVEHLVPINYKMSLNQAYSIDVYTTLVLLTLIIIGLILISIYKMFKALFYYFFKSKKSKQD